MGGFSYDRNDYDSSSSSGWADSYSGGSSPAGSMAHDTIGSAKKGKVGIKVSMKPDHRITSKSKQPIIIVLDVTGSNIDLAQIVYDKMPMFYGQIEQKKYLDDFDVCFIAVGDAQYDDYPLQVGNFGKGVEIDDYLESIVLEGGGGPGLEESYDLAALYLCTQMDLQDGAKPIIFFQGDEKARTPGVNLAEKAGIEWKDEYEKLSVWNELNKICNGNVFFLQGDLGRYTDEVRQFWNGLLPKQHVISVEDDKAVIDTMLGIISMVSSARDLESYKIDMIDRGQSASRISMVTDSLKGLSTELAVTKVNTDLSTVKPAAKTGAKAKRL